MKVYRIERGNTSKIPSYPLNCESEFFKRGQLFPRHSLNVIDYSNNHSKANTFGDWENCIEGKFFFLSFIDAFNFITSDKEVLSKFDKFELFELDIPDTLIVNYIGAGIYRTVYDNHLFATAEIWIPNIELHKNLADEVDANYELLYKLIYDKLDLGEIPQGILEAKLSMVDNIAYLPFKQSDFSKEKYIITTMFKLKQNPILLCDFRREETMLMKEVLEEVRNYIVSRTELSFDMTNCTSCNMWKCFDFAYKSGYFIQDFFNKYRGGRKPVDFLDRTLLFKMICNLININKEEEGKIKKRILKYMNKKV